MSTSVYLKICKDFFFSKSDITACFLVRWEYMYALTSFSLSGQEQTNEKQAATTRFCTFLYDASRRLGLN